jgi:hypothetical protein
MDSLKKKIVRVEPPTEKYVWWRVWVNRDGVEYPIILSEKEYKVLTIEQHLTEKLGYDSKALLEYKEAIVSQITDSFVQLQNINK